MGIIKAMMRCEEWLSMEMGFSWWSGWKLGILFGREMFIYWEFILLEDFIDIMNKNWKEFLY
jgi:hypothetical protein